jgi:hypothetical protein
MTLSNPYTPPKAEVSDIRSLEAAPALWNPSAAASWSLLFSPVFGSFLHMRNWQALGQSAKAEMSRRWFVGSIAYFAVVFTAALFAPDSKALDLFSRLGGLILLIAWYYAIGKSQQAYVAARFGKLYPRRGWAKPLFAAIGIVLAFFAVIFVLAVAVGAMQGAA